MIIQDHKDGKLIILSKAFDNRPKILNFIYFSVFTLAGIGFFILFFSGSEITLGLIAFSVAAVGIFLLAGYRFLNKSLQTEKLLISATKLVIEKTGFLNSRKNSYDIAAILNLRHLGLPEETKHPLAGQNFDPLGFQTEQQVINEMHGNNRVAFDYGGRTISFGENLYSWDFDEIDRLIKEVTGNFDLSSKTKTAIE